MTHDEMSTKVRNLPTVEGYIIGNGLARWFDEAKAKLGHADAEDSRCSTCAFRPGTDANGSPFTTMDALKCVVEAREFMCHHDKTVSTHCHGWLVSVAGHKIDGTRKAPWPFSSGETK